MCTANVKILNNESNSVYKCDNTKFKSKKK